MANKIDSNITGLRFAEESALKTLPGSPVWRQLEPNSYKDFGGQLSTMVRRPIDPGRQNKKGAVTDFEASGGFTQDFTIVNSLRLLQGVFFADIVEHQTTEPMNTAPTVITSVTASPYRYTAASGLASFLTNHLILASGFGIAGNNGMKVVASSAAGYVDVGSGVTAEASPPAGSKIEVCGYRFASATIDVTIVGGLPRLARMSGVFDLTTLGLTAGEWIYLGSDTSSARFTNNRGFARIRAVAAAYIELDKTDWTPQAEVGTGLTIDIYFGSVVKNKTALNEIIRRSYQLERSLGQDTNGTMSEYLTGACIDQCTFDFKQADKITVDFNFIACDLEQRTGTTGLKSGTRPTIAVADAYNTSSDFTRIKLASVSTVDAAPTPLFAYATEMQLNIKNNMSPTKALGNLGAIDVAAGIFDVSGSLGAYFADVTAVQAVRNNADVTIDIIIAKNNQGVAIDLPLLTLGDGRLKVEQDKPITLNLDMAAAQSTFGHTMLVNSFPYLPTAAM